MANEQSLCRARSPDVPLAAGQIFFTAITVHSRNDTDAAVFQGETDMQSNGSVLKREGPDALPEKRLYGYTKRCFDIAASVVLLFLLLLPMAAMAAAIRLDSPGNPVLCQIRLGKDQKPFVMYKFRTMYLDAEKDGIRWTEKNDHRVTRIGQFLRKTRMDELPQLVNILLGQMSFVGPRPERPEFYDLFDTYIIGYRQRMQVTPGLTGYAQINGGYDLLPEEKLDFDMRYIRNRSIWLDLYCLWKTIGVVFNGAGAR